MIILPPKFLVIQLRRVSTTCLVLLLDCHVDAQVSCEYSRGNYLGSEVLGGKRPKWSGLNEEVQKSLVVITSDSPKRAFDALLALEGFAQDASREACASLKDGTLAKRPTNADKVVGKAPFVETVVSSSLPARRSYRQGVLIG